MFYTQAAFITSSLQYNISYVLIWVVAIRIRCRRAREPVLSCQLNLNDLLDAAISILPKDAYALLMLVHQDLYEDDDDDFCCGRAYVSIRVTDPS